MEDLTATPRDQLDRLLGVLRRALRYWWVVVVVMVVGGGLSALFAFVQKPVFESETVLLYREMIPTSVIQGREVVQSNRNMTSRYKEMVMARGQLQQVAEEFELLGAEDGKPVADEMRKLVGFRSTGAGAFRIVFHSENRELAQKVAARLADLLIEEDKRIAREEASTTKVFLEEQKARATQELHKREKLRAEFLAQHPEFAEETAASSAGASIRAAAAKKDLPKESPGTDPRILALARQRNRIRDRLDAPDKPSPRKTKKRTPEQIAAEQRVKQAERDVDSARRTLEDKLGRFTERHPDVIKAKAALEDAQKRLRRAEAAVPSDSDEQVVTGPIDRAALRKELAKVERELSAMRARVRREKSGNSEPAPTADESTNWVVQLETQWAALTRDVQESRDRVESLEAKVFTAEITADSVAAQTSKLTIIDPANLPERPVGKGKSLIILAGLMVFTGLGAAVALGLSLIDDRIYTRFDLEGVGIGPVLVEVPRGPKLKHRRPPPGLEEEV